MSSLKSFNDLADELIEYICQYSIPLIDPWDTFDKASYGDYGYWTIVYRRLFCRLTRLPVPSDLLSLRLVSRRLNRISTPFAWQRVDLQITKETSNGSEKRSRNSFGVLDFISSREDIASFIKVLSLDVQNYLGNDEEYCLEIGESIEKLLRSLTSLMAFNIASAAHLSPDAIFLTLSKPTLRLLHVSGKYFAANDDFNLEGKVVNLDHLEAYCTNKMPVHGRNFIMEAAPNLKYVVLHHHQDHYIYLGEGLRLDVNYPWLTTVEELEIADSAGIALQDISEAFKDVNDGKRNTCLKELRLQVPWREAKIYKAGHTPGTIACCYAAADLRILSLYEICSFASDDLFKIAKAFPNLVELGFVASSIETKYFDEFVGILGGLKYLRTLEWSIVKLGQGSTPEGAGLPELCALLPMLNNVIVTSTRMCDVPYNYFYKIERDPNGAYKGASVETKVNLQTPITSWEVSTTPYLPCLPLSTM